MGIFVEVLIRAPMETLWTHTQTPDLHERWDLRFTTITYLPKAHASEPQRFRYSTRIGFGVEIAGEGESVGERDTAGGRTSSLRFSSDDPRAIISEGSGYWKYKPSAHGIQFLTWYDYRTRYGAAGAVFDRVVFRPLMAWATAWSFDRLRLWLEEGIAPESTMRHAVVHATARVGLALIFLYQGLVPKLLTGNADEMTLLHDAGIGAQNMTLLLTSLGIAEVVFAAVLLVCHRQRWPLFVCLAAMVAATIDVALFSPGFLRAAFNPVSLNLATACLAAIDLAVVSHVPSASRCRWSSRTNAVMAAPIS